jgi:hypothetical protein|tara:strand:+ start:127 stop:378 length:252 start_codon:yes stop_codon:yes gene_type:complete
MKRKRGDMIGYQKDELLVETTSLNLMYNRAFHLEHNTLIFEYAKTKEVEFIFNLNALIRQTIENETYIGMEDIKIICQNADNY